MGDGGDLAGGFADRLARHGDAVAIVHSSGETISYAALAARADAFAATLPGHGLLLLEAYNDIATVAAYLGALRARCPVLLVDAAKAEANARLAAIFSPSALAGISGLETRDNAAPTHPDLAVCLSTSGTTGAAKLVRLSHDAIEANARSIAAYLGLDAAERGAAVLPIHYSYGLSVINSHLAVGARVLLTDLSATEAAFWTFLEQGGATSLPGVPYSYEIYETAGLRDRALPALATLTQAGGRLPPETAALYARWAAERGARFFVMYGQTEATARISYVPPADLIDNPGAIGVAIPGGTLTLRGEEGEDITVPGAEGELVYRGPNVMMGYAEAAGDLAAPRMLAELRTGDLACVQPNGLYRITGRKSRFCKPYGLRISLDEVEACLRGAGVSAFATGTDEMIAIAFTGDRSPAAVAAVPAAKFGLPKALFEAVAYAAPPVLASGKIDYRTILADAGAARAARPAPGAGESVHDIFAAALRRSDFDDAESFASLGGDSLSYVSVSIALESRLGRLPDDWSSLSIAELQALGDAAADKPAGGFWSLRSVSSEVVLRALAIVSIVAHHATHVDLGGGIEVLLLLLGLNIARFQRERLISTPRWALLGDAALRLVLPYYALIAFVAWRFAHMVSWPDFLLVSNFFGREKLITTPYWFVEAYMQTLLILILLGLVPPVRRAIVERPRVFGLCFLAVALVAKLGFMAVFGHAALLGRTPDQFLYLIALGWCLHTTKKADRVWLILLAAVIAVLDTVLLTPLWVGFDGQWHGLALIVSVATLALGVNLRLPHPLRSVMTEIALASLYIYLVHPVALAVIERKIGHSALIQTIVAILIGIAITRARILLPHLRRPAASVFAFGRGR